MRMADHTCHWPGCSKPVPPRMWGCRPHWYKLPQQIRDRIWSTYRAGQEITKTPSREYVAAAREAQDWIAGNQQHRELLSEIEISMKSRQVGRTDAVHRLECEARHWLREGYTRREQVDELIQRIAKRRGEGAAELLRDEMRRQWARRADWLTGNP